VQNVRSRWPTNCEHDALGLDGAPVISAGPEPTLANHCADTLQRRNGPSRRESLPHPYQALAECTVSWEPWFGDQRAETAIFLAFRSVTGSWCDEEVAEALRVVPEWYAGFRFPGEINGITEGTASHG
jgi:hypothetical protein